MRKSDSTSISHVLPKSDEDTLSNTESFISSETNKTSFTSYGFLSKVRYEHKSQNCEIQSVTYNSKTGEYIIVDSRGISAWKSDFASSTASSLMKFPTHGFNVIRILLYCRSLNLYFALTKECILKIYNLNFHEPLSIESDVHALIHMVFNTSTGELITASRSEIYIWEFGQLSKKGDLAAATTGLLLKLKWGINGGQLINRIKLDEDEQRIYCLSEADVWCYDLSGKEIFVVKRACPNQLSACAYGSNTVIAGSVVGQVSLSTTTGSNIHFFFSHSNLVTEIIVHPCDAQLILTASLDGYIKLFSMDLLEELYSLKVFSDGIEHMSLKSNSSLYCVSTKDIEEFDLNYFCQFWGLLRYPAQSIELIKGVEKSARVIVVDSNSTVKLFSITGKKKICTVLPPPIVNLSNTAMQCIHDRDYNLVYILVNEFEVWVYTTKTDPACFLANINIWKNKKSWSNPRDLASSLSEHSTVQQSRNPKCYCIEILQDFFKVEFVDAGGALHRKCNLLACGMETGQIILFNPIMQGRKENSFQLCRNPIIKLKYCKEILCCLATTKSTVGLLIKLINSNLEVILSISCDEDITFLAIKEATLAVGFASGHIIIQDQLLQQQKVIKFHKQLIADHQLGVVSISFHPILDIFCSSGKDFCIKVWNFGKRLLREIALDNSLTSVCFLNGSEDILAGFKGHLFLIRNSAGRTCSVDNVATSERPASQVYERPDIKYETKRPKTPELQTLENYLVPYSDMIFKTIGTWVVQDDGSSCLASDENDMSLSDLDSDDDSLAPSDVYQSSLFSVGSSEATHWTLPDCGASPVGSIADEVEREEVTFVEKEIESDDNMPLTESEVVDVEAGVDEILISTQKGSAKKPVKLPKFAHNSLKNLKNATIDAKKVKIARNSAKKKEGKKENRDIASPKPFSQKDKPQHMLREGEKRRIVKKSGKPVSERKRVAAQTQKEKSTVCDSGSQAEEPKEKEATIPSPVDLCSGSLLISDNVAPLNTTEPDYQGNIFGKDLALLQSGDLHEKDVYETGSSLTNYVAQTIEALDCDDLETSVNELRKEDQDSLEHIDMKVSISGKIDDTADDSDQLLTSNDVKLECVTEKDVEADNICDTHNNIGLEHDIDTATAVSMERSINVRSDRSENISARNRAQKSQQRTLRSAQDKAISKVVPAYYQAAMLSKSKRRGEPEVEFVHAPVVHLAIKSEKMKFYDSRESSPRHKRNQSRSAKNESAAEKENAAEKESVAEKESAVETRPVAKGRHSQPVRVAFGETVNNQRELSSSTIALCRNKSSIDVDFVDFTKQEQNQDGLVKFCISAFKKRPRKQKFASSRMFSADVSEISRNEKPTADDTGEELRPQTAPLPQRTIVDDDHIAIPNSEMNSYGDRGMIENNTNCLKSTDISSLDGSSYPLIVNIKERNSFDSRSRSKETDENLSNDIEYEYERQGTRTYERSFDSQMPSSVFMEKENSWKKELAGTFGRVKYSPLMKGPSVHETASKRADYHIQNYLDTRRHFIKPTTPRSKQSCAEEVEGSWQATRKHTNASPFREREASERFSSPESSTTRASLKSKVLFVKVPRNQENEEISSMSDFEWPRPESESMQEKLKLGMHGKTPRVMSPQDKLLKQRAASASMRRRQEDAMLKRREIEEQRAARAEVRCIRPPYTKEQLLRLLSETEDVLAPGAIYEYNKPEPFYPEGKLVKSDEKKGMISCYINTSFLQQ